MRTARPQVEFSWSLSGFVRAVVLIILSGGVCSAIVYSGVSPTRMSRWKPLENCRLVVSALIG